MSNNVPNLLTANFTPLEQAAQQANGERWCLFDGLELSSLWDPATCPPAFLPFLAWAWSVDYWDENWSVNTQRSVVGASLAVHRINGTRKAVEDAFAALGFFVEIEEWFQYGGDRGTCRITVFDNESETDTGNLTGDIARLWRHHARRCIHYQATLASAFTTRVAKAFMASPNNDLSVSIA